MKTLTLTLAEIGDIIADEIRSIHKATQTAIDRQHYEAVPGLIRTQLELLERLPGYANIGT